ncbi:MAG: phenylalanine--tRNA ligase subunit beta, partial [Myxococcota bacterium]
DPRSVRRTSRRTGLHTDASHRFERGVDPNAVPAVLARAAQLMAELGGGVALAEGLDVVARAQEAPRITLRRARLDALLGYAVPKDVPAQVLTALGATEVEEDDASVTVTAPSWRPDWHREVDLIEEVARIHGYEHVPTAVPRVRPSATGTAPRIRFERALREQAAAAGLFEAVSYSFVSPAELAAARAPLNTVALANPLSEERSVMRTSLLPGLAAAARQALRRQAPEVLLFELGRVFAPTGERLPEERPRLGLLVAGQTGGWIGAERDRDFYDLKGFLEAVLAPGGLTATLTAGAPDAPWLHPKRQATVHLGGTAVGSAGELHPEVADALELEGVRLHYADLDVGALFVALEAAGVPQAPELARFPAVTRDVALLVDDALEAGAVGAALAEAGGALVEGVALFDLYRGDNVPAGKKSLAFRVTYRDPAGTLTDKRVDKAHAKVRKAAESALGATLR